jgi:hypothetical protein
VILKYKSWGGGVNYIIRVGGAFYYINGGGAQNFAILKKKLGQNFCEILGPHPYFYYETPPPFIM